MPIWRARRFDLLIIDSRRGTRSRIFSHHAVIFSVGIHVVIFMSKCGARHRIIPDPLANPRRSNPFAYSERGWEMGESFDANGSMETRKRSISRDGQWLLSLSANLCKLTVPKTRVRLFVWTRRIEQWNGRGKPVGPHVIFAPAILIVIPRFYYSFASRCRRRVDWCERENDWDWRERHLADAALVNVGASV